MILAQHRSTTAPAGGEDAFESSADRDTAQVGTPRSTVSELLDFFEKCPRCGYHATATLATRPLPDGGIETTVHPSCGLPCGWYGRILAHRHAGGLHPVQRFPVTRATDPHSPIHVASLPDSDIAVFGGAR